MKQSIFRILIVFFIVVIITSCHKDPSLHSTPPNYRLASVQKITTINGGLPKNELFTIYYYPTQIDDISVYSGNSKIFDLPLPHGQEVSQILFTTDDTSIPKSVFNYFYYSDTILRTGFLTDYVTKLDSDTFVVNNLNQIISVFRTSLARIGHPRTDTQYQLTYFGSLLTQMQAIQTYTYPTNYDGGTVNYTSYNGDFWKSTSSLSLDSVESFVFYPQFYNRTGDYLQIQSFLLYGKNIYQNAHLVKQIQSSGYTTNVNYVFDSYNKITETTAIVTDSVGNIYNYTYKLAYQTF